LLERFALWRKPKIRHARHSRFENIAKGMTWMAGTSPARKSCRFYPNEARSSETGNRSAESSPNKKAPVARRFLYRR
jgi:hypothetical protein